MSCESKNGRRDYTTINVPVALAEKIDENLDASYSSRSELIRDLLRDWLKEKEGVRV